MYSSVILEIRNQNPSDEDFALYFIQFVRIVYYTTDVLLIVRYIPYSKYDHFMLFNGYWYSINLFIYTDITVFDSSVFQVRSLLMGKHLNIAP